MEDNLILLRIEDDLNLFVNVKQPQKQYKQNNATWNI
jgi:hypothetical protein